MPDVPGGPSRDRARVERTAGLGLLILAVGASHRAVFGIALGGGLALIGLLGLWFVGTRVAIRVEVRADVDRPPQLAWTCALRSGAVPLSSVRQIDGVLGGYLPVIPRCPPGQTRPRDRSTRGHP